MNASDVAGQYTTYEERLISFQTAQPVGKRRTSSANSKAPKNLKWPHKFLSPEMLAKAGFFYYPFSPSPDNCACFLCHSALDGWEEGDDPLAEHLKHSPNCGWAIMAAVESQDGVLSQENPNTARMIAARKATFGGRWPHESKKGWKCKTKQMVDAGWKYTPTPESDDMATCSLCQLALDGWEPADKPLDEHFSRSPECPFFSLINNSNASPASKKTKSKKDRSSKVSRLSTQSAFTIASDVQSINDDLPAEEGDSILTTATNATASQGMKKMGKAKKTAPKGKKTRVKKSEAVEVVEAPEPEDANFKVKVEEAPKAMRGRKRKSAEDNEDQSVAEIQASAPKRRATRTRGGTAIDESVLGTTAGPEEAPKTRKRGRPSANEKARVVSTAPVASLHAHIPDDDTIDRALEADLERPLTDDEEEKPPVPPPSKNAKTHAMFNTEPIDIDEAAIDAELEMMEVESKPLPKAKGAKGKQPRKVSAKQQAAARQAADAEARRVAEVEAEAARIAEEDTAQQIVSELEHSVSIQHSSPIIQPKRQRATSRTQHAPKRDTRASTVSVSKSDVSIVDHSISMAVFDETKDDSGNETDASMESQSTIVRGGSKRRGSTLKKGKSKKAISRHIEEIVHKSIEVPAKDEEEAYVQPSGKGKGKEVMVAEQVSPTVEETLAEEEPELVPFAKEQMPKITKSKSAKGRGRPAKAAISAAVVQDSDIDMDDEPSVLNTPTPKSTKSKAAHPLPRIPPPTPTPKEATPSQSPQSSDAENHPPSSKPSAPPKHTSTPRSITTRVPLAATTPSMSPSKRNIIAGLQSTHPWTAVDLDSLFLKSPGNENGTEFGAAIDKVKNGELTSPEKKMTVEEWIKHNAQVAEEKLKEQCEKMVGRFESEGTKAMRTLEGIECVE